MIDHKTFTQLNQPGRASRIGALTALMREVKLPTPDPRYINNHIHTTYSFSPYSPTAAAFLARYYGLCTAGIMDHDSIGGAAEFIEAGELLGLPTTIGLECRVSMAHTALSERRMNNPDQTGVSYITLHAVPHENIGEVQAFFTPLRARRNIRNRAMTSRINDLLCPYGIAIDFDRDVLPLSEFADGGSVTERHLMFALGKKLIEANGKGAALIARLKSMDVILSAKQEALLLDVGHPFYEYDLLGILKSAFVPLVYLPATDECLPFKDMIAFAGRIGAIFCYAYLGDVEECVTGDKATQKFEDAYLDELMRVMCENNVRAVTYMPPRNSPAQLARIRALAAKHGMLQISGEDINSPRQEFVCKAMEDPQFKNLIDATWALIGHERGNRVTLGKCEAPECNVKP